jgi:uncharacterized membrane protein YebE (DUF533 family)
MSTPAAGQLVALDTSQVKNVGILAIVVIVVIGLVLARLMTKIVTRLVVLVVVAALAVLVYQQRGRVESAANNAAKRCDATFFGVHVQPHDPTIRKACAKAAK